VRAQRLPWQRRQEAEFACPSQSIISRDMAQLGEECVAIHNPRATELIQSMLSTGTRRELAAADRQHAEHQQALVIHGKGANVISKKLERSGMLFGHFTG
jgi:hypothetical protein